MNMQKMGKLCKENMSMKLYRKGCTQYISDGITMVEIPRNFPALCDENEAAAVFGWTDKQLDEISCEVEELDVINDLYEVTGISIQKLQEALYKVQGRATTIAGALRQAEENDRRYKLERERLELARMKATGEVEVDDDDAVYEQGSGPVVGADGETDKADAGCRHYPGSETGAV